MIDVVKLLFKSLKEEDKNKQNIHGFTCLHIAAKEGLLEMCEYLFNEESKSIITVINFFRA